MANDPTLDCKAMMGSMTWAAQTLGMSYDNFIRKRAKLEENGFPARHRILGLYIKSDVEDWIKAQKQVNIPAPKEPESGVIHEEL